jgi:hypothetical protein
MRGDVAAGGAVLVPFAGHEHDWAALELGTCLATAHGAPLHLIGVEARAGAGRSRREPIACQCLARRSRAGRMMLARRARSPVVLVRRALRPGGTAPPAALTRSTWSGVRGLSASSAHPCLVGGRTPASARRTSAEATERRNAPPSPRRSGSPCERRRPLARDEQRAAGDELQRRALPSALRSSKRRRPRDRRSRERQKTATSTAPTRVDYLHLLSRRRAHDGPVPR